MKESEKKVGQVLLELGLIDEAISRRVEQKKPDRLIEFLIASGIDAELVRQALAVRLKLPEIILQGRKVEPEVMGLVPENWVNKHGILPLERVENTLLLGMVNPFDIDIVKDIRFKTGLNVRVAVISETELAGMIQLCYGAAPATVEFNFDEVLANVENTEIEVLAQDHKEEEDEEEPPGGVEAQGPMIRLVDRVIQDAVNSRTTDVHIEPTRGNVHVRYRIDGVMRDILDLPKYVQGPMLSRIKVMGSMDISEKRRPQDGRSKIKVGNRIVDLRISSLPTMHGEKIVIRLLEQKKGALSLKDLGLSHQVHEAVDKLLGNPQGMILVTGPTGSGKTTALYSALSRVNNGTTNIVTVEDPVEYQVAGINQVQINVRAGMTFAGALRSILRQDPDVILVGEMRDHETAEVAFHAAQTGHLVLSTLHTNDAASTITRLLAMDMDPYLIASSVLGIMSQRLVRRLCVKCKVPTGVSEALAPWLPRESKDQPHQLFAAKGCKDCLDTGYWGRFPVAEILVPNDTIRDFVLKGRSDREILNVARKGGMKTIFEDGIERIRKGETTFEELTRVVAPQQAPPADASKKKVPLTVIEKSV
jgi:type IV pilus assembly protein PilB